MVNFKNNVTVVIATLKRYRYGSRAIQISMGCYNVLNESMVLNGIQWFSMDYALEWCEHSAAKYLKSQYRNAIYRLYDVYEYGRILDSHLVVYAHPSKQFQNRIEECLSELLLAGGYTQAHLTNIRHKVVQFCCFIQYNGAGCFEDIGYSMLDDYDRFLRESSKAYYINEGLVSGFLEYISAKGRCRTGIAPFIAAKEKKGRKENTIKMYRACSTRFCGFLVSSGVTSFAELSPGVIKGFYL